MIEPHEIDFNKFIKSWTIEGSRGYFEKFVYEFLKIKHKFYESIKKIRPNPGDWGIDIICGNFKDFNIIWQCKFFPNKISNVQRGEIRESFKTIINKSKEKKFKIYNIEIDSLTLSNFQEKCSDPEYQNFFKLYFREEEILKPHPEAIDLEIDKNSIFIQLINNSDVSTDLINLKKNFFLADYFEKDILLKNSEYEIQQLKTIYDELLNVWEIYHNKIYSNRKDDDGNDLFISINEYLINKINYFNQRFSTLTISILLGLILKMSERKEIFWTRNLPIITN